VEKRINEYSWWAGEGEKSKLNHQFRE